MFFIFIYLIVGIAFAILYHFLLKRLIEQAEEEGIDTKELFGHEITLPLHMPFLGQIIFVITWPFILIAIIIELIRSSVS